jgi:hypothetical protein
VKIEAILPREMMPTFTEPQDDGLAEDIQESAEAALAATSQGI